MRWYEEIDTPDWSKLAKGMLRQDFDGGGRVEPTQNLRTKLDRYSHQLRRGLIQVPWAPASVIDSIAASMAGRKKSFGGGDRVMLRSLLESKARA